MLFRSALVRANFDDDLDGARDDNLRAIDADPTDPHPWAQLAGVQTSCGEHDAACRSVAQSLRLSPLDPSLYVFESYAAMAHVAAGAYAAAVAFAQSSLRRNTMHLPTQRLLVGALWLAGREGDSRAAAQQYLALDPRGRTLTGLSRALQSKDAWQVSYAQALQQAGLAG